MTVGEEESIGPGSLWLRWDPHVHAPGTIFNDQFKGDWEAYLAAIEGATPAIRALGIDIAITDPATPLIADDADLTRLPLGRLDAEIRRLGDIINVDKETRERFNSLSTKITTETELLSVLQDKLKDYEGAEERAKGLPTERQSSYRRIFEAVFSEQQVLNDLYAPIGGYPSVRS